MRRDWNDRSTSTISINPVVYIIYLIGVDPMALVHVKGKNKGKVILYALSTCVWCNKTKKLLTELGVDFYYVYVDLLKGDEKEKILNEMTHRNPRRSFPTLIIDDKTCIVGYQERKIREVLS